MPEGDTELGRVVHTMTFDDRDLERSFAKAGKQAGRAATGELGAGAPRPGAAIAPSALRLGRRPVAHAVIATGPRGEKTAFLAPGGRGPVGTTADAAIAGKILSEGRGAGVVGKLGSRVAGVAAAMGPVGVAVAAVVVGLGAMTLVVRKVNRALNRMGEGFAAETRRLAYIDPTLAGAAARARVAGLRRDIGRGQAIGGQLSTIERIRQRRLDIEQGTRNALDRAFRLPLTHVNELQRLGAASLLSPTGPIVRGLVGGQGLAGILAELFEEVKRGVEAIKNPRKTADQLQGVTNAQFRRDMEAISGVPGGFLGRADEDPARSIQFRPPDTTP